MARYNWIANTQTYRLRGAYDFGKANLVEGLRSFVSYTNERYDEDKTGTEDANVYYFGSIKEIQSVPNLSARFRIEYVEQTSSFSNDHTEMRMELNYLF